MTEETNLYAQTMDDLPKGIKKLAHVGNRPYGYGVVGLVSLVLLYFLAKRFRIVFIIAMVVTIVLVLRVSDVPVIDIFEGYLVCHDLNNPDRVLIIPNERMLCWGIAAQSASTIMVYFVKEGAEKPAMRGGDPRTALSSPAVSRVAIRCINASSAQNALTSHYKAYLLKK